MAFDPNEILLNATSSTDHFVLMKGEDLGSNKYVRWNLTRLINTASTDLRTDTWQIGVVQEAERSGQFTATVGQQITFPSAVFEAAVVMNGTFVGGGHGNEVLNSLKVLVDGVKVSFSSLGDRVCRRLEYFQASNLFLPGSNQSTLAARAFKRWLFERQTLTLFVRLELQAAVTLGPTYLCMLPMRRTEKADGSAGQLAITTRSIRAPHFFEEDISMKDFHDQRTQADHFKLWGDVGYSADIQMLSGWSKPNRQSWVSDDDKNKVYLDVTGVNYASAVGEVIEASARIAIRTNN